jgi:dTDP-4-dehydrorhamnose 3,5-epimerase
VTTGGWFARVFCAAKFDQHGLTAANAQINLAETTNADTVRGLHYRLPPANGGELVRCVAGAIVDVVVDTRRWSPTSTVGGRRGHTWRHA